MSVTSRRHRVASDSRAATAGWSQGLYRVLKDAGVTIVAYVPDAGHRQLIELCHADRGLRTLPLTTEEEGVGLAAGAWLGGGRTALLMQSSGVGNCVNALAMVRECRFPLLMLVTMRGEFGEFNPWQVPMGRSAAAVLEAMGVIVHRAATGSQVVPLARGAAQLAFGSSAAVALLISQSVVGVKAFRSGATK